MSGYWSFLHLLWLLWGFLRKHVQPQSCPVGAIDYNSFYGRTKVLKQSPIPPYPVYFLTLLFKHKIMNLIIALLSLNAKLFSMSWLFFSLSLLFLHKVKVVHSTLFWALGDPAFLNPFPDKFGGLHKYTYNLHTSSSEQWYTWYTATKVVWLLQKLITALQERKA